MLAFIAAPAMLYATDPPAPMDQVSTLTSDVPAWRIRLLDLGGETRFNYMDRQDGPVTDRGLQYHLGIRARIDLLKSGNTYLTIRAETGKGFDNSWNNTGVGLGRGQAIFNVKAISLHQKLTSRLEAEAGGLDFDRGAGTDAIYASGDGHMTGYRAVFNGRSDEVLEKISFTAAYVGDFDKPNFFSRSRMDRVNYAQLLAAERFSEQLYGSEEVDSIRDAIFVRAAVRCPRLWELDDVTVEAVTRTTDRRRFAWSSSVSRHWTKDLRWRTDLIYSDLPYEFYVVNGQRVFFNRGEIDVGKRLALGAAYRLTPNFEAGIFAARLLDSTPSKRWIAQVGLSYQFAGLVNQFLR
ncbi:MAG TPA: hypothetical protein VKU01_25015 [Bryobacteraceae bacterium]|nr:hypothetical protein [Bryobacteraceae bacterium]